MCLATRPPGRGFEVNATTEGLTKGLWLHHWQALGDHGGGDDDDDGGGRERNGRPCGTAVGAAGELAPAGGAAAEACWASRSPHERRPSAAGEAPTLAAVAAGGAEGSRHHNQAWGDGPVATLLLDSEGLGAPGGDLRGYDSKLVKNKQRRRWRFSLGVFLWTLAGFGVAM